MMKATVSSLVLLVLFLTSVTHASEPVDLELAKACDPIPIRVFRQGTEEVIQSSEPRLYLMNKARGARRKPLDRMHELRSSQNLRLTKQEWIAEYIKNIRGHETTIKDLSHRLKGPEGKTDEGYSKLSEEIADAKMMRDWSQSLLNDRGFKGDFRAGDLDLLAESAAERKMPFRTGVKVKVNGDKIELWQVASDNDKVSGASSFKELTSTPSFTFNAADAQPGFTEGLRKGRVPFLGYGGENEIDVTKYPVHMPTYYKEGKGVTVPENERKLNGSTVYNGHDGSIVLSNNDPRDVQEFHDFLGLIQPKCKENPYRPSGEPGSITVITPAPESEGRP